jgi:hypothetical protein
VPQQRVLHSPGQEETGGGALQFQFPNHLWSHVLLTGSRPFVTSVRELLPWFPSRFMCPCVVTVSEILSCWIRAGMA